MTYISIDQPHLYQALRDITFPLTGRKNWPRQAVGYLEMGGQVDDQDFMGWSMLHSAVLDKNVEFLRWLMEEEGADPDIQDCLGQTPLHHAVATAFQARFEWHDVLDLRIIRALLKLGADPLIRDSQGHTPRDLVRPYGPDALVQYDVGLYVGWAIKDR